MIDYIEHTIEVGVIALAVACIMAATLIFARRGRGY